MDWIRVTLGIVAVALLATPVRADDKPVTLSRTFNKGDVVRMSIETTVDANGSEVLVKLTSRATVKAVKDAGQLVVESQDEAGKVTVNGSDMDIPAGGITTLTYDKTGKLVEFKAEEGGILTPEVLRLLETMRMPILSDKQVKSGDSWQTEFDNPAVKGKKFTVKTTFAGVDKVDGADLWRLKQEGAPDTDANGAKMGYDGTYWLDPATGQIVKADVKIKDEPTIMYGTLTLTTKSTRIKPETK
ncbi:MAG TPA: hypothetical protein VKT77_21870 [Chthonomonadaceae bacterium]|nr:hypothetical protein [Chthonomonadaceae bacterium]